MNSRNITHPRKRVILNLTRSLWLFAAAVIHEKQCFDAWMVPPNSMELVILSNKILQGSVADSTQGLSPVQDRDNVYRQHIQSPSQLAILGTAVVHINNNFVERSYCSLRFALAQPRERTFK